MARRRKLPPNSLATALLQMARPDTEARGAVLLSNEDSYGMLNLELVDAQRLMLIRAAYERELERSYSIDLRNRAQVLRMNSYREALIEQKIGAPYLRPRISAPDSDEYNQPWGVKAACQNCGLPGDTNPQYGVKLFRCGACKTVHYCTKSCQRLNWRWHKSVCGAPASKSIS